MNPEKRLIIIDDLKPCPFCGESELEYFPGEEDYFIQCQTCTTTGPNGMDKDSAVFQWNHRSVFPTYELAFANELMTEVVQALAWYEAQKKGGQKVAKPPRLDHGTCLHIQSMYDWRKRNWGRV